MSHKKSELERMGVEPTEELIGMMLTFDRRLMNIEQALAGLPQVLGHQGVEKEWYSTTDLATALGVTQFTIQERYCNAGRIECMKDPDNGKWRIPGHEFQRLVRGGPLKRAKAK